MERLDKIISTSLNISRNDAKALIKKGFVSVDGKMVKSPNDKADEKNSCIICQGKSIKYSKFVYIMMNKPKGVISAAEDGKEKTVIDILPEEMKRKNLFPAGRLDKDTTGFMLITDDGEFAHRILSPKNHISKTYAVTLDKPFDDNVVKAFENGIELKNDICMPAEIISASEDNKKAVVTIKQGMYHQIKRMFGKFGLNVVELERIKMGGLELDKVLGRGDCRYLTDAELKIIEGV
ncbi:MAG: rRNA pseudouridine synthase [Acetobacter sp.]|nr:rRNA pseudouridine synthase [Bacteroides sp.]MCM1341278.1 rRNA pseudouridine synthase [Acetobacter sp.]MCM1433946.1 rRNA pseudouridine synthase [Clostridiales bacterium]